MRVGRPKKIGNDFCELHKAFGFIYTVEPKPNYVYPRIRHNDRKIKDHYIDAPLKYGTEYSRNNQVTSFSIKPYDSVNYYPPIHHSHNDSVPIVIYEIDIMSIPFKHRSKIKEIALTENEKKWILNSKSVKTQHRVKHFYNEILHTEGIITFGYEAKKLGDEIGETGTDTGFIGNITYRVDRYGMFDKILKTRERSKKISKILREEPEIFF